MTVFDDIRKWAEERNLCRGKNRQSQMLKLAEEHGELARAIVKGYEEDVMDAIGDMVVVLTILADQTGVTIEHCIQCAYETIKDRKGKLVGGVFVKDEE
jgi:NTP pyrophosphatase (non-canonical NTP hydrolase)